MSEYVFISYARKDGKDFAQRLYDDLKQNSIEAWMDTHDIRAGKEWYRELEHAIDAANKFIVVLTPGSVESMYVENEIIAAIDRGIEVIPLLALDCKMPLALKRLQYIDFRRDYARAFEELYKVLQPQEDTTPVVSENAPTGPKRIGVMIVDDHNVVRRGLTVLLEDFEDLEIVGTASDGVEAVNLCTQLQPDVVLMDLVMPRMDGVEATRTICQSLPNVKVIITTSYIDEDTLLLATDAGAISFLMKNTSGDELVYAIRRAHANQPTLAPEAAQLLIDALHRVKSPPPASTNNFTEHEREILALMIDGLNNHDIAERLTVSISTVNNGVTNILAKLGASNRIQAIAMAVEHKVLNT